MKSQWIKQCLHILCKLNRKRDIKYLYISIYDLLAQTYSVVLHKYIYVQVYIGSFAR